MAGKTHINLAVVGHIDHGKSTLIGRLLHDTGAIEKHVIEKYKKRRKRRERGRSSLHG
jgi:Translation elongation factor EF-1alpha (GTPase)